MLGLKPNGHGSVDAIPGGLCERWRDMPVAEIDEDAIVRVIDEARRKGVPGLERRNAEPSEARARALFSALSVMFNWLRERRRVRTSPLAALKRPATPRSRERVLSDAEIAKFWEATAKIGEPFASALRIMLVTGARRDEVSGMRRGELNAELSAWTLPAGRTKNKREHAAAAAAAGAPDNRSGAERRRRVRVHHHQYVSNLGLVENQEAAGPADG